MKKNILIKQFKVKVKLKGYVLIFGFRQFLQHGYNFFVPNFTRKWLDKSINTIIGGARGGKIGNLIKPLFYFSEVRK